MIYNNILVNQILRFQLRKSFSIILNILCESYLSTEKYIQPSLPPYRYVLAPDTCYTSTHSDKKMITEGEDLRIQLDMKSLSPLLVNITGL